MPPPTEHESRDVAPNASDSTPVSGQPRQPGVLLSDVPDVSEFTHAGPGAQALNNSQPTPGAPAALAERYEILGKAGRGSMGSVYKARDRETQHVVVLKIIPTAWAADRSIMNRLGDQIRATQKINHRSICRVLDFCRVEGTAWIASEFVEGESLRSMLHRLGGLPLRKAIDLALQICSGLKEAHVQSVFHGHLNAENVMIDLSGNAKVVGFGLAPFVGLASHVTGRTTDRPVPLAPEQVVGSATDSQTEIYSLGAVLYELFTGAPPFLGQGAAADLQMGNKEPVIPPHEIEPAIPVSIERAILKCLEKDPAERFQSVAELEAALMSSGTRAILASASEPPPSVANREAIKRKTPGACSSGQLAASPKHFAPLVWVAVLALIAAATAGAARWITTSRAAERLSSPGRLVAPVPPSFALEKAPIRSPERKPQMPVGALPRDETDDESAYARERQAAPRQGAEGAVLTSSAATYVWIGRFELQSEAQDSAKKIEGLGFRAVVVPRRNPSDEFFVVLCGPFGQQEAVDAIKQLETQGFANIHTIKNLIIDQNLNP